MPNLRRLIVIFASVLTLTLGSFFVYLSWGLPDVNQAGMFRPDGSLQLTDRKGVVIYNRGSGPKERLEVKEVPKSLKLAAVASEDRRFYDHNGVDLAGIGRAIVNNFKRGQVAEGGSTITQQLARILFLNRDKNLGRKFQEALLALKLEQTYTKDEILAFYLNYSYFGAGAYGAADASKVYFNKSAAKLTTAEAALLVGLLPAPSVYSPLSNPNLARKRRDLVLKVMADQGVISQAERKKYTAKAPRFQISRDRLNANAYFTSYVQTLLPGLVDPDLLERGGLLVETTLDAQAQALAQQTLSRKVQGWRSIDQGALVSLDPTTGEILALVGGTDFTKSQFNRATQALRQPGSSFKTFIYLAALDAGYSPTQTWEDRPIKVGNYTPKNSDGQYLGAMNLMQALAKSRNTIAVQLMLDVGIDKTVAMARRMGITSPLQENASLALGSSEVQLLEITRAYGILANQGVLVAPYGVKRVRDRQGRVLYEASPQQEKILDQDLAWTMTQFLRQVVIQGTGRATQVAFEVAGKTGTTDLGRDLWFVGYTPKVVTGVWLGNDNNQPTGASSSLAAQLWGQYMRQIVGKNSPDFMAPPGYSPNTESQIVASIEGTTQAPERPSRPSEVDSWLGTLLPPEPEDPVVEELPLEPLPVIAPPVAVVPIAPEVREPRSKRPRSNCYAPGAKSKNPRCRNRKN